jgi:hypothetical protein
VQELAAGVTVIVLLIGELEVFVPLKAPILPFPDAPKPMLLFEFVHAYVVPETGPEKLMAVVELLLQIVCGELLSTIGVGLTMI